MEAETPKNELVQYYTNDLRKPDYQSNYISFKILETDYLNTLVCSISSFFVSKNDNGQKGEWYKFKALIEDLKTEESAVNFLYEIGKVWYFALPKKAFENALKKQKVDSNELRKYKLIRISFKKVNSKTLVVTNYELFNEYKEGNSK